MQHLAASLLQGLDGGHVHAHHTGHTRGRQRGSWQMLDVHKSHL
jgi:hypothetical protein